MVDVGDHGLFRDKVVEGVKRAGETREGMPTAGAWFELGFAAGVDASERGTVDYLDPYGCAVTAFHDWANPSCGPWSVSEPPGLGAEEDG